MIKARCEQITWRKLTTAIFAVAASLLYAGVAFAADPSPEQCTCDIPGYAQRTGAQVVNAGSCVLVPRYPWCDIYLATTENSNDQAVLVSNLNSISTGKDGQDLERILIPMLGNFAAATARTKPDLAKIYEGDIKVISVLIDKSFPEISTCLDAFRKHESTRAEMTNAHCSVGQQSGWLRIKFSVNDRSYIFLFSPNG